MGDHSCDAYEKAVRPPAGQPAIWSALGTALARPGALCRHRRLRVRPGAAERVAIPRLGCERLEPRPALRSIRPAPTGRRRGRPRRPRCLHRDRLQSLLPGHGRPERPGFAASERLERHHRDDGPGVPWPDDRLRPLPRSQVRPDPPGGFLPAPGVLHARPVPQRLSAGLDRASPDLRERRRRLEGPGCDGRGGDPPHRKAPPRPTRAGVADGLARRRRGGLQQARGRAQSDRGHDRVRHPQPRRADQGQGLAGPARPHRGRRKAAVARETGPVEEGPPTAPADRAGDRRVGAPGIADVFSETRRVHRAGTGRRAGVPVGPGGDFPVDHTNGRDNRATPRRWPRG